MVDHCYERFDAAADRNWIAGECFVKPESTLEITFDP